jgi:hypothetical protein
MDDETTAKRTAANSEWRLATGLLERLSTATENDSE